MNTEKQFKEYTQAQMIAIAKEATASNAPGIQSRTAEKYNIPQPRLSMAIKRFKARGLLSGPVLKAVSSSDKTPKATSIKVNAQRIEPLADLTVSQEVVSLKMQVEILERMLANRTAEINELREMLNRK